MQGAAERRTSQGAAAARTQPLAWLLHAHPAAWGADVEAWPVLRGVGHYRIARLQLQWHRRHPAAAGWVGCRSGWAVSCLAAHYPPIYPTLYLRGTGETVLL